MKSINIFKQLFNWVQSAPVDFCYVTGEWGFQENEPANSAQPASALRSADNHHSSKAIRNSVVAVAAAGVDSPASNSVPVTISDDDPNSRAA